MRQNLLVTLRVAALLVLLTAAVAAATAAHPRETDYGEFARALDRGEVVQITLPDTPSSSGEATVWMATWSTGPFQWRRGPVAEGLMTTLSDFTVAMRDRGVRITTKDDDTELLTWPSAGPTWVTTLLGLTWLAVFLAMLISPPTYGTRWAWFWMFVIGQVGALLYLVLEPTPLWRRDPAAGGIEPVDPLPPRRDRWNGLQGVAWSILLLLGGGMAAAGIGWAAGRLL
ncbi:hypothetical protein FK529_08525 [Tsukamurella asaccharolytica]|uniref:Uncharacterized protein n=1 Tax=Tsukamurella asaccharolytica TaxID=2592067 RepID=A0A5C5RBN8_9ACTN|nr:hypothetical protein [Tsukamurella asaccharolytica]TWS20158.1 hypothetical protein FK529_08525 [Tsukamurella asaccharolytica]